MSRRPRIVVAGMGDTGLLVAIHLSRRADVVGISSKPGLVSGQELGVRLARPDLWRRDYWVPFERYRRLDQVRTLHATLTGLDADRRRVRVTMPDGTSHEEPYDALVISTGVTNGFWRTPGYETATEVASRLTADNERLAAARSVAVIGGGAAGVSAAWNIARRWPTTHVDLYFPGERALAQHHPRVWSALRGRLESANVGIHPGHRADVSGAERSAISHEPIRWVTGQGETRADAVLWTIGDVSPNSRWLPRHLLDERGFVITDEFLRVPGLAGGYAIGDVAATDPLRSSARARADRLLAHNIRADLAGRPPKSFAPLKRRWGSVLGVQEDRLEVFSPTGRPFVIPAWSAWQPWLVGRGIYRGMRHHG